MKIGVLCNSKLSIPSIQFLVQSGHQVAMALPAEKSGDQEELEHFAMHFQLLITRVEKASLQHELLVWNAANQFDTIFVITFPYILPKSIISSFGKPMINFHFAPLPQYKGAQPAFWMIKNGEKKGGIAAHLITEKIDDGPILMNESYTLSNSETFGSYLTKMASVNVTVIQKVVALISQASWQKKLQVSNRSRGVYYPKLQLKDIRIVWQTMTAVEIERLCRACNPWNKGAITTLNGLPLKLVEVQVSEIVAEDKTPGQLFSNYESASLHVATCDSRSLRLSVVYQESYGFFSGGNLTELGLTAGVTLL